MAGGDSAAVCLAARARRTVTALGVPSTETFGTSRAFARTAGFWGDGAFAVLDVGFTSGSSLALARVRLAGALAFLGFSGFIPWVWDDYLDRANIRAKALARNANVDGARRTKPGLLPDSLSANPVSSGSYRATGMRLASTF